MTKKSRQKLNIMKTKMAFKMKQKSFFIIFEALSADKNCVRPEGVPLILINSLAQKYFLGEKYCRIKLKIIRKN